MSVERTIRVLVPVNGVFRFKHPAGSRRYDVVLRRIDTAHVMMVFNLARYAYLDDEVFTLTELDPLGDVTLLTEDELLVLRMTHMMTGG